MRQSIGQTYQLYFIVIFFTVLMVFIVAFISYMKAFRLNSGIAKAIEIHEGYNSLAKEEIERVMSAYGDRLEQGELPLCNPKKGTIAIGGDNPGDVNQRICVYEFDKRNGYFRYGIETFLYIDLPFLDSFYIPVYSETEKIYEFHVRGN